MITNIIRNCNNNEFIYSMTERSYLLLMGELRRLQQLDNIKTTRGLREHIYKWCGVKVDEGYLTTGEVLDIDILITEACSSFKA